MNIHTHYLFTYIYIYILIYMHIYIYMYMNMYIYIYIHMYTHVLHNICVYLEIRKYHILTAIFRCHQPKALSCDISLPGAPFAKAAPQLQQKLQQIKARDKEGFFHHDKRGFTDSLVKKWWFQVFYTSNMWIFSPSEIWGFERGLG